jgi:hypothetical protein
MIRDNNVGADVLSKQGSTQVEVPAGVFVNKLHHPSIKTPEQSPPGPDREVIMLELDWREPFTDFIKD